MNLAGISEHLAEKLEDVTRHWEAKRKAAGEQWQRTLPHQPPLSIALAREAGTQGSMIAREVGKRLQWAVYDHELLELVSQDMGIRTQLLESIDERHLHWLRESFEDLLAVLKVSELAYIQHLVKTVLALGSHGECIIVGRGAGEILPAASTLRVRLIAPLEARVAVVSRGLGLSREEARRKVQETDRERRKFVQDHFMHDPADLGRYDLVLDSERFGVAACVQLIVEAARGLQARASVEAAALDVSQQAQHWPAAASQEV